MTSVALAFAAGVCLLQAQASLPAPLWGLALPACVGLALWRPALRVPAALAVGFLWAALAAHARLADRLAPALEGRDLEVVGVVAGLPARGERALHFDFDVEHAAGGLRLPHRLRLAWYLAPPAGSPSTGGAAPGAPSAGGFAAGGPPAPHPGDRWRVTLRLRRPHGNVNLHGFDYEAWLLERGIGATGYVRARPAARRLGARYRPGDEIERLREAVRDRFLRVLGATPAAGVLAALAVGDQHAIPNGEWRLFQRTGVTHLMSISGLHVTLVSGLIAWLIAALWRRVPALCLALPARKAAAGAAIAAAFGYAVLAGFAVPAQRTFYMVAVFALALWSGRIAAPGRSLALALAAVLLLDPWAPLAPGFWLSFGAVALIFYVAAGAATPEPRLVQWLRVQWAITVGLAPAALLLFAQVSLVGPLANAVAIPLVSAVITPLALVAAVVPVDALLGLDAWLVGQLLAFLHWCAALPIAVFERPVPPLWAALLAFAGIAWLLAPRGLPWRATGLALLVPAFALPAPAPVPGATWITVIDVGQGLAVLARTAHHALLYDAGPAYGAEADAGSRVIVPLLRALGVARLDMLVATHDDVDHIGGAPSVMQSVAVQTVRSSLAPGHPLLALARTQRRCELGERWRWDGVGFEFLHPAAGDGSRMRRDNNLGCVLRVSAGAHAMLLTADIERRAEAALVARAGPALAADVLLAPHHGSRTSSTPAFLDAVGARTVVVSAGYRNRFRHPNARVLARYRARGAEIARTDLDGAVTVRLGGAPAALARERVRAPRYWRARPAGD